MEFDFLDDLSLDQRRELHTKLSYDLREASSRQISSGAIALWNEIRDILPNYRRVRLENFLESFGRNKFEDAASKLEALLDRALPKGTRRPIRDQVKRVVLQCLADYLGNAGIAISAKSLLNSFDHLEHAIDQQYPGYIACQLLDKVAPVFAS